MARRVLDAAALRAVEPQLRRGLAGALACPGDRVLYPPAAARWFLERAVALGARLCEQCAAVSIGGGAVRVRGPGGVEEPFSAAVVNAAGADAPRLTPGLRSCRARATS